jgi:hypothetical protein
MPVPAAKPIPAVKNSNTNRARAINSMTNATSGLAAVCISLGTIDSWLKSKIRSLRKPRPGSPGCPVTPSWTRVPLIRCTDTAPRKSTMVGDDASSRPASTASSPDIVLPRSGSGRPEGAPAPFPTREPGDSPVKSALRRRV